MEKDSIFAHMCVSIYPHTSKKMPYIHANMEKERESEVWEMIANSLRVCAIRKPEEKEVS